MVLLVGGELAELAKIGGGGNVKMFWFVLCKDIFVVPFFPSDDKLKKKEFFFNLDFS